MWKKYSSYYMRDVEKDTKIICSNCKKIMKFAFSKTLFSAKANGNYSVFVWHYKCGKCNLWQQHYAKKHRAS